MMAATGQDVLMSPGPVLHRAAERLAIRFSTALPSSISMARAACSTMFGSARRGSSENALQTESGAGGA